MIDIKVEGIPELIAYLAKVRDRLTGLGDRLGEMLEGSRRYAAGTSPVVTGSYRGSHRVVTGAMKAELSIDPAARNTRTGVSVSRYAGPVERRHGVYSETYEYTKRLAGQFAREIGRSLVK